MATIGKLDVQSISTQHILDILQPIWLSKTETAARLRGRIERILDWAAAKGLRQGENPARWCGHLQNLLAAPKKVAIVEHHPSMPHNELPKFYQTLSTHTGAAAQALQLLIMCASRTNETIGARWCELDMKGATRRTHESRQSAYRTLIRSRYRVIAPTLG
jgi:integrase